MYTEKSLNNLVTMLGKPVALSTAAITTTIGFFIRTNAIRENVRKDSRGNQIGRIEVRRERMRLLP